MSWTPFPSLSLRSRQAGSVPPAGVTSWRSGRAGNCGEQGHCGHPRWPRRQPQSGTWPGRSETSPIAVHRGLLNARTGHRVFFPLSFSDLLYRTGGHSTVTENVTWLSPAACDPAKRAARMPQGTRGGGQGLLHYPPRRPRASPMPEISSYKLKNAARRPHDREDLFFGVSFLYL
jgi:hypothetical protein